jgi:hypothetical protein
MASSGQRFGAKVVAVTLMQAWGEALAFASLRLGVRSFYD